MGADQSTVAVISGVTGALRGGSRLTPAIREARRAYVGPLFEYCTSHSVVMIGVVRRAALRRGVDHFTRNRLMCVKRGTNVAPEWFIAGVCREIGQPIEVVMGAEWAQRHLYALPSATPCAADSLEGGRS